VKRLIVVKGIAMSANVRMDDRAREYRATCRTDESNHQHFLGWSGTEYAATGDTIEEACDHLSVHMRDFG
jgi:hypothetical protein